MKRPAVTSFKELELFAAQLARAAGEHIAAAPLETIQVHLKRTRSATGEHTSPVSNIDVQVEQLIRASIATRFPSHVVLGEESEALDDEESAYIWVVDPIDGTSNYLNGLPLYGCSIGVLYKHFPVVGAVWCASTHTGRPGVYHAFAEGALAFDGALLKRRTPLVRGIASEPGAAPRYGAFFDTRVLASASLECAFAAAGMIQLAYISDPRIWDVAAGIALARAAGCRVLTRRDDAWIPFGGFTALNARKRVTTLRTWRQPVLIGDPRAIDRAAALGTGLA